MKPMEWNPGTLLQVSGGYWQTCALHAAVELDLFTALGAEEKPAPELAGHLDLNADALARLLNALAAMGLVAKKGDRFCNTPFSARFLNREDDAYVGYIINHHRHLFASWGRLGTAVRKGGPVRERASRDEDARESFLMGMFNMGMRVAPEVVKAVDLSGCASLLDLGGGPGTFALHFCRHNPGMRATVFDLPTTRPFAEKTIRRFELEERVRFTEGDYTADELPGSYDAAWLSHILHGEGPQPGREIVRKAAASLKPGGRLVIHEFVLDNDGAGPLFPALFSLNMLLGTDAGRSYTEAELEEMMTAAGLKEIARIPFDSPTGSGLIMGVRS